MGTCQPLMSCRHAYSLTDFIWRLPNCCMSTPDETPLQRARAKLRQIERELKKSPDFQLYIIAKSQGDRARMKRVLMQIPNFRLWRVLKISVERAQHRVETACLYAK
jgi:hypothetical protein